MAVNASFQDVKGSKWSIWIQGFIAILAIWIFFPQPINLITNSYKHNHTIYII
jgi:hypothetical protein